MLCYVAYVSIKSELKQPNLYKYIQQQCQRARNVLQDSWQHFAFDA